MQYCYFLDTDIFFIKTSVYIYFIKWPVEIYWKLNKLRVSSFGLKILVNITESDVNKT